MEKILKGIEFIEDIRQQAKVRHKLLDIIVIVPFAKLACPGTYFTLAKISGLC